MRAPNRVLMNADTMGGVWTYSMELSRVLASQGTEVILATMGCEPSREQVAQAAAIGGLRLVPSTYKLEWMPEPWAEVEAAGAWLLELEEQYRPDLVHLNGYSHGSLDWEAPCVVVAHSCVYSWWNAVHGTDPPGEWEGYRASVLEGLRKASAVATVSKAMARALEVHYGYSDASVIYNGCDEENCAIAPGEPFIFAAGRIWDEAKNMRALDQASAAVPWPVLVAGAATHPDGSQSDLKHARALGVLTPDQLRDFLARASIYAAPALYEPFGLGVLEAALRGCALVLGDIPSFRELWDGVAVFVPATDSAALAQALNLLVADPIRTKRLAELTRRRALRYSSQRMLQAYLELYAGMTEGAVVCA